MLDSRNYFNEARAGQFADKLVLTLNNAATALMISIGHRTGLFDAMADLPSSSAGQIAVASGKISITWQASKKVVNGKW